MGSFEGSSPPGPRGGDASVANERKRRRPASRRVSTRVLERELARPLYLCGFRYRLEAGFQAYNLQHFAWQMRTAAVLSIILYAIGGLLDYLFFTEDIQAVWFIRYAFVLVGLAIVAASFHVRAEPQLQWLFMIALILGAIGTQLIMAITPGVVGHPYVIALPMIAMVGYIFVRLRFWYAVAAGWFILLVLLGLVFLDEGYQRAQLVTDIYFMLVANFLGMAGALLLETQIRKNYLRSSLLEMETLRLRDNNEQLQEWSFVDALTGTANRRHLQTFLEREWARAVREKRSISLVMVDIDHFKHFNDRFGHQAGDACLRRVADVLVRTIYRANDMVARYGGEEFVIVLPDTGLADAEQVAERIREEIHSVIGNESRQLQGVSLSISAGVASMRARREEGPEALIALADAALYEAKRLGRDRVESARAE